MCLRAESGERAVTILARRLDGRRDFSDFVPFTNFLCAWSCTLRLFPVCIYGRYRQGLCKVREVGGRGRGVQTVEEREREGEGKRQTTRKERNHASGCCLLRGQVTQNEKLLQEHFIRAHPAQKGCQLLAP